MTVAVAPAASNGSILFFLGLNDRGGAEISMITLAQGLLERGCHVILAAYGANPELARELGFKGEIINFKTRRTLGAFLPLFMLLRRERFATLVTALTHTNIVAALAAPSSTRVILTEHGLDGITAVVNRPFFAALVRFAFAKKILVAVSEVLAKEWRGLLPKTSVTAIYNPVIPDMPSPPPPPAHPWLEQGPVILGLGRLRPEKNFAFLLEAFAEVAKDKEVRLAIVGEGPEREPLEHLAKDLGISDYVLMPGFAQEPRAWLAHAALLVCPSRREGFGNVIVEALAEGIPVVASDCPFGPAEILDNGRYGRLVPVDDVIALEEAIHETLNETPTAAIYRARARDFTITRCLDAYLALMNKAS